MAEKVGQKSLEGLYHFRCPNCEGWFSIGDAPKDRCEWGCPWCYAVSQYLEEKEDSVMQYKVPFRGCYTGSFIDWLKWTFWCHVVIKVFPHAKDFGSDALVGEYLQSPEMFFEQYQNSLRLAAGLPEVGL